MPYGYNGKVLRVDLSQSSISVEEPGDDFYRCHLGGRGFISHYLLKELRPGIDPLSPENKLIFATGVVTGAPVGGSGRNSVGGKSPLTNAYGDAEVGGYWGAELKFSGYDAIIVEGKAERPAYIWINDSQVEIRDARHLWGKATAHCQSIIQEELGDAAIRTAQIGPAGENLVRYACIINDLSHAAGRTGMGAVMGSKNLKAIAVRGHNRPPLAEPERIESLQNWLGQNFMKLCGALYDQGTAVGLLSLNRRGGLPTRNFQEGVFEGAEKISGRVIRDTILVKRRGCYACPIRCKREVALEDPYQVDPVYGGPEYETVASLGSDCGVDDLGAIAKGGELCNAYGLDTISTGASIAFAMECFERGILTVGDTEGLDLHFGNAQAMVQLVEMIARRKGIGGLLAEGVARAAREIGRGAEEFALHVKGQELPMHEPRYKQGLGLGYAVSPTGADHCHNIHDDMFARESPQLEELKALGVLEPLPCHDLSPAKVRMLAYYVHWRHLLNCLVWCMFVPFNYNQIVELVQAATGWNTTTWELMKAGERCATMTRAFNIREGLGKEDDTLPQRFFAPFTSGPLKGISIDPRKLDRARTNYYSMMGWDRINGVPTQEKLEELGIDWVLGELVD